MDPLEALTSHRTIVVGVTARSPTDLAHFLPKLAWGSIVPQITLQLGPTRQERPVFALIGITNFLWLGCWHGRHYRRRGFSKSDLLSPVAQRRFQVLIEMRTESLRTEKKERGA
jgi:hypothetical protein